MEKSIRCGYLVDGTGQGIKKDVIVTVKEGIITSITRSKEAPGAEDLSDSTLIPLLVDCHVHLSMPKLIRKKGDDGNDPVSKRISSYAACGVCAVRDATAPARLGKIDPGGLVVRKAAGAYCLRQRYGGFIADRVDSGKDLVAAILSLESEGHVKIFNSGLNSTEEFMAQTRPQFDVKDLKAACRAAGKRGVMVHANGRFPVKGAILAGCRSIEHGFFMGYDNLAEMAERRIFWVPTIVAMEAVCRGLPEKGRQHDVARKTVDHQLKQLLYAERLGVMVAAGSDAGLPGVGHGQGVVKELALFLDAGIKTETAVRYTCLNGALLTRTDAMAGSLVVKKPASFIAVRSAPGALLQGLKRGFDVYVRGKKVHRASMS